MRFLFLIIFLLIHVATFAQHSFETLITHDGAKQPYYQSVSGGEEITNFQNPVDGKYYKHWSIGTEQSNGKVAWLLSTDHEHSLNHKWTRPDYQLYSGSRGTDLGEIAVLGSETEETYLVCNDNLGARRLIIRKNSKPINLWILTNQELTIPEGIWYEDDGSGPEAVVNLYMDAGSVLKVGAIPNGIFKDVFLDESSLIQYGHPAILKEFSEGIRKYSFFKEHADHIEISSLGRETYANVQISGGMRYFSVHEGIITDHFRTQTINGVIKPVWNEVQFQGNTRVNGDITFSGITGTWSKSAWANNYSITIPSGSELSIGGDWIDYRTFDKAHPRNLDKGTIRFESDHPQTIINKLQSIEKPRKKDENSARIIFDKLIFSNPDPTTEKVITTENKIVVSKDLMVDKKVKIIHNLNAPFEIKENWYDKGSCFELGSSADNSPEGLWVRGNGNQTIHIDSENTQTWVERLGLRKGFTQTLTIDKGKLVIGKELDINITGQKGGNFQFTNNGQLVFDSDASGDAFFKADRLDRISIPDKHIVRRHYQGKGKGWYFMGPAVKEQRAGQWEDKAQIYWQDGSWGNLVRFNEKKYGELPTSEKYKAWEYITDPSEMLQAGKGYKLYMWPADNPKSKGKGFDSSGSITLEDEGELVIGDHIVNITKDQTGDNFGWNLLANPYTGPLSLDAVLNGGVGAGQLAPSAFVFDASSDKYYAYMASDGILDPSFTYLDDPVSIGTNPYNLAQGQAFFVYKNNVGTLPFTFTEAMKEETNEVIRYRKGEKPLDVSEQLLISLIKEEELQDRLLYRFAEGYSEGFDSQSDVRKYYGGGAHLMALAPDGEETAYLAIETRGYPSTSEPFYLHLAGQKGEFSLDFTEPKALRLNKTVYLYDSYLDSVQDIRIFPHYKFEVSNTASGNSNRFELRFEKEEALADAFIQFPKEVKSIVGDRVQVPITIKQMNTLDSLLLQIEWSSQYLHGVKVESNHLNDFQYFFNEQELSISYKGQAISLNPSDTLFTIYLSSTNDDKSTHSSIQLASNKNNTYHLSKGGKELQGQWFARKGELETKYGSVLHAKAKTFEGKEVLGVQWEVVAEKELFEIEKKDSLYLKTVSEQWLEVKASKQKTKFSTSLTTMDLIRLQAHISGEELFSQQFQAVAADWNEDGMITYSDREQLVNALLGREITYSKDWSSLNFIPYDRAFAWYNGEVVTGDWKSYLYSDTLQVDFIQIEKGRLSNEKKEVEWEKPATLYFGSEKIIGNRVMIPLILKLKESILGGQFSFEGNLPLEAKQGTHIEHREGNTHVLFFSETGKRFMPNDTLAYFSKTQQKRFKELEWAEEGFFPEVYTNEFSVVALEKHSPTLEMEWSVEVYPNPAQEEWVMMSKESVDDLQMKLMNEMGQEVLIRYRNDGPNKLRMFRDGLQSGVYLLQIRGMKANQTIRVLLK